jgi:GNAT superfamily N-acetyltransferase
MSAREQAAVKLTVRRTVTQDISRLLHLKSGQLSAEKVVAQSEHRLGEVEAGKAEYMIVEMDGQIVGHVFLKFYGKPTAPDCPDIEDLYVHPDFRRKGVATELLRTCEKIAKARGFATIGLAAGVDESDPGRKLYEKLGYIKTGGHSYVDGIYNGVEDWVIDLVKELKFDTL